MRGHEPTSTAPGMSKYRLVQCCGEPKRSGGYVYSTVYDDGVQRFFLRHPLVREVTLENARVVSVHTLKRGFNPR